MKTKSIIIAVITVIMVFSSSTAAFAKTIPDHYSKFIGSWAYETYGFEYHSLAFRLKAGEIYSTPSGLPDGTSVTFYYVCDGKNTIRLSTPSGEVITRVELENYFVSKTQPQATAAVTPAPAVNAASNKTVPTGILEKDLAIWNDEDYELYENELEVVRLVNEERAKAGLKPVTINLDLCKVARIKAIEMVALSYFSHESPNYGAHADMVKKFGIDCKYAGENAARLGGTVPKGVMYNWLHSAGHKKHILNPKHKEIGIGVAEKDGIGYWSLFLMY